MDQSNKPKPSSSEESSRHPENSRLKNIGPAPRRAPSRTIKLAHLASIRAGPIKEPVKVLSDEELNAPIVVDGPATLPPKPAPIAIQGYQITRELPGGGQACVYEGAHDATGQRVAIKVMAGGPFAKRRHLARFEQEANLLASFNHPNIVGIIDRGRTADGSWFFAMRYIDGFGLDRVISLRRSSSTEEMRKLIRLFVKVAGAMDEAHRRNVVHRDLKPSNIRVDRRGEPYVLDFGLASSPLESWSESSASRRALTASGEIVGSLPWASPEQLAHEPVDARSDVYALGVMLYQTITDDFPYPIDGTIRELLDHIIKTIPRPPCSHANARPVDRPDILNAIVLRALAKNPTDRYARAGELAQDLQNYLEAQPTLAQPQTRRSLPARFKKIFSRRKRSGA